MPGLQPREQDTTEPTGQSVVQDTVYVVDDDAAAREYLCWLLGPLGWRIRCFDNPRTFLDAYIDDGPACLVADLRLPELSGLDLQKALAARNVEVPVIMISAYGQVSTALQAMRGGALDFLEKPFDGQTLIDLVGVALAKSRARRLKTEERARAAAALARLTPRQSAVLDGMLAGKPKKIIASELGLSPRTVEVHRLRLMQTLGVGSLFDLFLLVGLVRDRPGEPAVNPMSRSGPVA